MPAQALAAVATLLACLPHGNRIELQLDRGGAELLWMTPSTFRFRRALDGFLPEVPAKARRSIHGSVKVGVKVRVNASGSVEDAQLASQGPSSYFAGLAVEAARQWKFSPLAAGGQAAPSQWLLHFEFDSGATRVQPERMAP